MSRKAAALTRAAALFALLLSSSAAAAATISGKVFEDVNYGGGAGRSHAASSGVGRTNARVELYDGGGAYVTFTTTDAAGAYSFPGLLTDNYTVRVVNSTVSSSRTGYAAGVLPVQTYRTDASGGAPVAVTDHVGGQNPSVADAGNGAAGCTLNTTTGVFTGGGCSGTAQSVTNVALGADVAGLDFGFNFDTIVNVNDVGQGSLRQFLANAAALGAEGALAQSGSRSNMEAAEPLPLSRESSIFMISDGLAHPGLRAGLADQLTGGVAVIAISSGILPALSGVNAAGTVIDGTTQTINVGDTNPGMAGFAGSVGLGPDAAPATGDEPLLAGVPKPEVQVQGVTSISYGLRLSANDVTLRGSSVYGFSSGGLQANVLVGHESVVLNNTGCVLEQNILGASAGSFTDPGVGVRSGNINVYVRSAQDGRVQQNAFGFVVREHLRVLDGRNWQIADNELRQGGLGGTFGGLTLISNSSGQVSRNLVEDDAAQAVLAVNATIDAQDNTIVGNASEGIAFFQNPGVPGTGQISRNEIIGNGSAGVMLLGQNGTSPATTQVRISRNRFGGNGGIAVDLLPGWSTTGVTPNDGILLGDGSVANSCGVIPSSGNEGLDTPIIDSASLSGGLMTVVGRACPGSEVEVYLAVADGDGSDTSGGIGFGEGVRYLGTTTADGVTGAFVLSDIAGLAAGNEVGALAIDALNNTSEFGANASVTESTAVSLVSFEARAGDGAVELFWETGSERHNAGFHLYRGLTENGPWERITETMIRGLGSTPEGRQYSYLDPGLVNATTYYYRLEDVEISGKVTSHGPVSATPQATAEGGEPEPGSEPGATRAPAPGGEGWVAHGDPADVSLREVARTATSVTFELRTGGFDSLLSEDGTTRIAIPGFMDLTDPGRPMLPTKRLWTPALAGRDVRLAAVQTFDLTSFDGLRLPIAGAPEAVKLSDGTSRASFRAAKAVSLGRGSWPRASAQVLQTAFQREEKKAYLELAPLTLDASSGRLTLARRMLVQVSFDATLEGETGSGSVGRRVAADVSPAVEGDVLARFVTSARGVYTVTFEDALGASFGVIPTAKLRLKHLGQDRSFSVEPRPERFGPGSVLYFLSDGSADAYTNEAVYELTLSAKKTTRRYRVAGDSAADARSLTSGRGVSSLAPVGLTHLRKQDAWEQSSYYGGSYTEATDPWMWDNGLGLGWGAEFESKDYPFTLAAPDTGAADARLVVTLQASNDTPASPDVHVLVSLNGTLVAETHFDGMAPHTVAAAVSASLLLDGTNTLNITVGPDSTEYLGVHLDRFSLEYPRSLVPVNGVLEGVAPVSGAVSVSGFGAGSVLLDLSGDEPRWLRSTAWGGDTLGFYAKAGHHYLAVSSSAVLSPVVRSVAPNSLRDTHNQADWILITPREFLDAAQPLVAHRQGQGLATHAVALEDVYDAFGYGEPSPQAIKDFLSYAFHSWAQPSPGYVFLLGEATYDPKGYLGVKPRSDRLPTQMIPGPFGWTASDLAYAAVNGDDDLPDIAIGRLNVNDVAEVIGAVGKILDFETNPDHDLYGNAVLVADVPDPRAGDFEANAYDIASLMPTRPVQQIFRRVLGDTAGNAAILRALDSGASLISFVGHGGSRIWAYANFLDADHPADLLAQTRQPLMLTMTCSTGYFLSPTRNSITETFVLAQGKGAIAAFSPTSESYNDAAHLFHSAVVQRLESRAYSRLGDLILDAQVDYANSGAFPELLALYHLFGDPALNITPAP